MNKKCNKKRLEKIIAMWIVAQGKNGSHKRRKERMESIKYEKSDL